MKKIILDYTENKINFEETNVKIEEFRIDKKREQNCNDLCAFYNQEMSKLENIQIINEEEFPKIQKDLIE